MKRAKSLYEAAQSSIGNTEGGAAAKLEIAVLIADYETKTGQLENVMTLITGLLEQIPYAKKLLEIKCIGIKTVSGFVAEVGDIERFDNSKQIQKLAGYELVEESSGKHKGRTRISKRGRKRLRLLLFEAAMSLVSKNEEFREIHQYYISRKENPLKKMQSIIAVTNKLIRIFFVILKTGKDYDAQKLIGDIRRPEPATAA